MSPAPVIAIVGRPNVGKSAIFNRMVGRRIAIVHDEPGVTRDRLTAPCKLTSRVCDVIDTGGIGSTLADGFTDEVAAEADIAMGMADLILFVLDCRDSLTPVDVNIANHLRRSEVPVMLLLNKADHPKQDLNIGEFSSLGFNDYVFVSAAHGRGLDHLASKLDGKLAALGAPLREEPEANTAAAVEAAEGVEPDAADGAEPGSASGDGESDGRGKGPIKVAVVGRPNAGKSSLINAILNDRRTIVSDVAGTTRDAIDVPYTHDGQEYVLIDTAGMRQRSRRDTSVEVFSAMRSEKAIRRADICLLVVDIAAGVTQQDRRIAGMIAEESKPCIIVVNKFDLFHPNAPLKERKAEVEDQVRRELFFIDYAPFLAVSALKAQGVHQIFRHVLEVKRQSHKYPGTGELNRLIERAMQMNPPGPVKSGNKRLRVYYATVAIDARYDTIPVPRFVLFANDKGLLQESYAQYLRHAIRKRYPAPGIPIVFSARSRIRSHD